jgi:hypothetical protein
MKPCVALRRACDLSSAVARASLNRGGIRDMLRNILSIGLIVVWSSVCATEAAALPASGESAAVATAPLVSSQAGPTANSSGAARNADLVEEGRQARKEQMFLDRWMIGLTCILGFIALLQLLAFVAQAVYMRKTFASARDTARRDLRAYLGFPEASVENLGDGRFQIQITVANSGRTRALAVTKWMKTALLDRSQTCAFEDQKFDRIQRAISPDSRWELREDHTWPDDVAGGIVRLEKTVHVWGQVRYTDIYGEPHMSNFRFRSQATNCANGTITGWMLEPHEEGNDLS